MLFLTFTCPSWRARLPSFLFYSWFRLASPHLKYERHVLPSTLFCSWFRHERTWIRHVLSSVLFFSLFRLSGLPASPYYETTGIRHFLLSVSFFPLGFVWLGHRPRLITSRLESNMFCLHSCFSLGFVWLGYRPRVILVITSRLESETSFVFILVFLLVLSG